MKKILLSAAAAALVAVAPAGATAPTRVTVVMRDPGCHWFSVGGSFKTKLAVTGPVKLLNLDEAALRIAGPGGVRHDAIGKTVALGKGTYAITMVGQASDDNHLKLIVR
jgi:hypothetical protein